MLQTQQNETMKQNMFRQIPVLQTQHRLGVQCCNHSIARLALLNSQHRFIVLHLQHGQHTMLHLQHPNHRASMLQCQHRAPAFVASTA